MTVKYTVELTDIENKALEYVVHDPHMWVENVVKNRCRIAIDEICKLETERMIADPDITEIPADKNTIIANADIKSGKERTDESRLPENMP